jgi:ParB-like chromosome segregation protein Spo0J
LATQKSDDTGAAGVRIARIPISQIERAHYNPRIDLRPGDEEYDLLAKGIAEFGLVEPLIFNEVTGRLVGGHQRLSILQLRGDTDVDVSIVHIEDEAREKALNLALNNIGGRWDRPKLKQLLEELDSANLDMELTGFLDDELSALLDEGPNKPDVILDQAVQLKPSREYIIVMCAEDDGAEFDTLKQVLDLPIVRRGGYKPDSLFDKHGVQRVIHARQLLEVINAGRHTE